MQLLIRHAIPDGLALPINYRHILQAIVYSHLDQSFGYDRYLHDGGAFFRKRNFKLFTFSQLQGRYGIQGKQILFRDEIGWEIRSPEPFLIQMLAERFERDGITYGDMHVPHVNLQILDKTVEEQEVQIRMLTPICVYSTDPETKKTYFYTPEEEAFARLVNDNFRRKYQACFSVEPESGIILTPLHVSSRDKLVTNYKGFYISGWLGHYALFGSRKYLDFLYQTGLGSKNSQGFGMFEVG